MMDNLTRWIVVIIMLGTIGYSGILAFLEPNIEVTSMVKEKQEVVVIERRENNEYMNRSYADPSVCPHHSELGL